MENINYFGMNLNEIDPVELQCRFSDRLKRHGVKYHEKVAAELFERLRLKIETFGTDSNCPFPLISSIKTPYKHAKTIKKSIGDKPGLSLGRCQMIFAETYGYMSWQALTDAVFLYYGEEQSLETKKRANVIQKTLKMQGVHVKLKMIRMELDNQTL